MKQTRTFQKAMAVLLTVLLALSATALGSFAADDYDLTGATRFVFSDSKITVTAGDYTGYKISGTALTINAAGTYVVSGSCTNGSIKVKKGTTEASSGESSSSGGFSFGPGNMPDMGSFDPGNMPDMGGFDPGNMPDMGDFDPGNMPDMGGMTPPGADTQTTAEATTAEPTTEEATEAATEAPQTSEPASDDATKESDTSRPSFSGMPDQSSNETLRSNLILFGVCFAIMLAALFGVMLYKRRK